MADGELLDAREAMALLGINENDLQTLVARGDLRAFRSAGTMKFRRDDVSSLKSDKGTEPTIIIPAASGVRKSASGILPTVSAAPRPPSRIMPPVQAPQESQTSDIVLDDIELMPTDDAAHTQQVTVQQPAIADLGGATVMEPATLATGEMTVVDGGDDATGPAVAITGSGRRVAVGAGAAPAMAAPAMSRVRAAVQPGVSMATSKRTMAVYQAKSASPFITTFAVLTSIVFLMSASIVVVMMSRGSFDPASGQRIIPPFLDKHAYRTFYDWTPGKTQEPKPQTEYPNKMIAPQ